MQIPFDVRCTPDSHIGALARLTCRRRRPHPPPPLQVEGYRHLHERLAQVSEENRHLYNTVQVQQLYRIYSTLPDLPHTARPTRATCVYNALCRT